MRKRQASKSAHDFQAAFGHVGSHQGGHRTFGFRTSPAESGTSVSAPPPARKALRRRICRAGPGFGPGAAKPADPGLRSMAVRRNQGFGRGARHQRNRSFGRGTAMGGRGTRVPNRRTANRQGFGPGRGARGETGSGFGRKRTPEEAAPGPPVQASPLETALRKTPRLPGQVWAKGQWGPAATPAPITVWAPAMRQADLI